MSSKCFEPEVSTSSTRT